MSYDHDPWPGDKRHIYEMATYQDVTTERYLGCQQKLQHAVNDRLSSTPGASAHILS